MNGLKTYQVFPAVPEPLEFLETLARNLWWCWHIDAIELFRRINPALWRQSGRNPILFSTLVSQKRLEELARDDGYLAHMERVKKRFDAEVTPYGNIRNAERTIAYFSMEFGVHESLPLFAGGLGVLAGDHLKAAADLHLPLVGVGLLYRQGYFHQYLNKEGWQREEYPDTDIFHLPVSRVRDQSGREIQVSVSGPDGEIRANVQKIMVGCIPLLLLDTNIPENPIAIRNITDRLYAGDPKQRLAQEVLLGIGGLRALKAIGLDPKVVHMNEGHSAFCGLERLCQVKAAYNIHLKEALEVVPRTTVFTTHTPVAAGHDEFPKNLVEPYVQPLQECLGVTTDEIIAWGQAGGAGSDAPLSMFVLGLRLSQYHNGVSQLHGKVARKMWSHVWPGWPEDEIPIHHVTNGVHIPSWISVENAKLFDRYLGPEWYLHQNQQEVSYGIEQIYDEELWQARQMSRTRMVRSCREKLVMQYSRRNAPLEIVQAAEGALDPDVLTIGFARRFATYKRATLLLKDVERLEKMILSQSRPVQFIFAGKAHPKDEEGKNVIKKLVGFCRRPEIRQRMVFLEDYDINIARDLVQGVDVWLNTPRRPLEASGTSGMKAAVNGVLNASVLDGWWAECYHPESGWAIGHGEEYQDHAYQDLVDSQALYNLLENEVIPTFYDRKNGDAPDGWIQMMKASMKMALAHLCTHRMVAEYNDRFYVPAMTMHATITANNAQEAKHRLAQRERITSLWERVHVKPMVAELEGPFRVGHTLTVDAEVVLGDLAPEEVDVELYYGKMKPDGSLDSGQTLPMTVSEDLGNGHYRYAADMTCDISGRFGYTVRVTPGGDDLLKFSPGLITWA
jgi:starch phosphorylase